MTKEWSFENVRKWDKGDFDIKYALFDFDGTVSRIRQGGQDIMIPYFCEVLKKTGTDEPEQEIRDRVKLFVTDLTGKQTIFQCIRLAEEVKKYGGTPEEPIVYKKEYLRRLEEVIRHRKKNLEEGSAAPDDWTVPGIRDFLIRLRNRGIHLYLASGTDHADVLKEARLLDIDQYFDGGVWGATDQLFLGKKTEEIKEIKAEVIRDMLEKQHIKPRELVSFGDGFVEVQLVEEIGGLAIGVATNEAERCGVNAWKRSRLIAAGAFAIIPDFMEQQKIIDHIFA